MGKLIKMNGIQLVTQVDSKFIERIKKECDKYTFFCEAFVGDISPRNYGIVISNKDGDDYSIGGCSLIGDFLELLYGSDVKDFILNDFTKQKCHSETDEYGRSRLNYIVNHYFEEGVTEFSILDVYGDSVFHKKVKCSELSEFLTNLSFKEERKIDTYIRY